MSINASASSSSKSLKHGIEGERGSVEEPDPHSKGGVTARIYPRVLSQNKIATAMAKDASSAPSMPHSSFVGSRFCRPVATASEAGFTAAPICGQQRAPSWWLIGRSEDGTYCKAVVIWRPSAFDLVGRNIWTPRRNFAV